MDYMLFFLSLFLSLLLLFAISPLRKEVVVTEEVDKGIMEKNFLRVNQAHQNLSLSHENLFSCFGV